MRRFGLLAPRALVACTHGLNQLFDDSMCPPSGASALTMTARSAFTKTRSGHLQKGKSLRNAKVLATKPHHRRTTATSHGGGQKSSSSASKKKNNKNRRPESPAHHIYPKSERLYTTKKLSQHPKSSRQTSTGTSAVKQKPSILSADIFGSSADCTEQEIMFANAAQIVGIMQHAFDAPTVEEERNRLFGLSATGSAALAATSSSHYDPSSPPPPIEASSRRRLRSFRVRSIDKVEIPPVEVPTDRHRSGGAFLPTEILRRVMREEPGTSISSRTVTLSCVVRENRRRRVQEKAVAKATDIASRISEVVTAAERKKKAAAVARGHPTSTQPGKVVDCNETRSMTADDLDDAALVGDAAIIVEEQANHTAEQLRSAISDERDSTAIEEAPNNGLIDTAAKNGHTTTTTLSNTTASNVTMLTVQKPAPKTKNVAPQVPDSQSSAEEQQAGTMTIMDEDGNIVGDVDEDALTQEEVDAFSPWREGTIIPLSTNYVTRCERIEGSFAPFSPHPLAKRIPLVQPLDTVAFPPLAGVAMYGTVVAVKVCHNSREALETAHANHEEALRTKKDGRSKKRMTKDNSAPKPAQLVLDVEARGSTPPKITIEFMNDDETMDFGRVLFDSNERRRGKTMLIAKAG
ncbi:Hypothetical protein, putative [Bodo saltans]|uniref:Uncharacterized protein n=1 Tax=Bodo saltans TaxID=75058 RepID=A0A0S4JPR8_BODSA|nr:Hypothetical protein, putative [Bodo saltans]|eukprot:CUG92169.1 Hypothetical protein, putative [Bodo saltans]